MQWLCDSFWGDEEADVPRQVLDVTILRLGKLSGNDEAVSQQGGKVWLDRHLAADPIKTQTMAAEAKARPPALRLAGSGQARQR